MLIVSQHMLRETELEAPEAYRGKVRLYSIRYKSDDCEVEGYAAVPAQFEDRSPLLFLTAAGTGSLGPLSPRSSAAWPQQALPHSAASTGATAAAQAGRNLAAAT